MTEKMKKEDRDVSREADKYTPILSPIANLL